MFEILIIFLQINQAYLLNTLLENTKWKREPL